MEKLFILLILTASSVAEVTNHEQLRDGIDDIINSTISGIINNISEPINIINQIDIPFDSSLINGSFQLTNINLTGIKNLQIPSISHAFIGLDVVAILSLAFSEPIKITVDEYKLDVLVLDLLPLYGGGPVDIAIYPDIDVSATLTVIPPKLKDAQINITSVEFAINIGGLMYDEKFSEQISSFLTELIQNFLNENLAALNDTINTVIKDIINGLGEADNVLHNLIFDVTQGIASAFENYKLDS